MTTAYCNRSNRLVNSLFWNLPMRQCVSVTSLVSGLESSTLNGRVRFENQVQLVARRHDRMRGFQSAEASQRAIVTAVTVVDDHVIVGAFMVRLDFEFVEHLSIRNSFESRYYSTILLYLYYSLTVKWESNSRRPWTEADGLRLRNGVLGKFFKI